MTREPSEPSKSARRTAAPDASSTGLTADERAALREHLQETRRAASRAAKGQDEDGESLVLAKIAELSEPDRALAKGLHAIIRRSAPALVPRLWYGMPAYSKDGQVLCFVQPAQKFKTRYATLGFSDEANLDDGAMWPTVYAVKSLTAPEEARVVALVKKAVA